ncbi:hypothetical protein MBMB1_1013 [Methanobacterium sp. MB1]|jgi:hypothetical protein|nr:hypothetical protein MBMB1_1013 [Methanobacterium sp. MB1]
MKLLQIKEYLESGKNLLYYKKDVYKCFKQLKDHYLCVYSNEPLPIKGILVRALNYISRYNKTKLNRLTISELTELLIKEVGNKHLIILFNNFDRLTEKALVTYRYLNSFENIHFICSFSVVKTFNPEVYSFSKTFKLVNIEEYNAEYSTDEINITYVVYAILSIYCFFIYLKTSFSGNIASLLIGGAWFAFLIFRTLMYTGGRS